MSSLEIASRLEAYLLKVDHHSDGPLSGCLLCEEKNAILRDLRAPAEVGTRLPEAVKGHTLLIGVTTDEKCFAVAGGFVAQVGGFDTYEQALDALAKQLDAGGK